MQVGVLMSNSGAEPKVDVVAEPSGLRQWLNSNRLVIVLTWALATWLLYAPLPPIARPLTSLAALVAALVAGDRILGVFFGILTLGIVLVMWLTGRV